MHTPLVTISIDEYNKLLRMQNMSETIKEKFGVIYPIYGGHYNVYLLEDKDKAIELLTKDMNRYQAESIDYGNKLYEYRRKSWFKKLFNIK